VLRGGGWERGAAEWHRVAVRYPSWPPSGPLRHLGFRVVLP
jgi:hypothetical protein